MDEFPLNLYHLRLFCAVVESGGYSNAAQRLCLTQPALSIQIRGLERSLGIKLFRRKGHGVELTEAGEVVYREAVKLLQMEQKLKRTVREYLSGEVGYLAISSNHPVGRYLLPQYVIQFLQRYPQVEVSITYENSDAVLQSVLEGRSHLGFVSWSPELAHAGVTAHFLFRDCWTLVAAQKWPTPIGELSLERLVQQVPLISLLPNTAPGKLLTSVLRRKGVNTLYPTFLRSGDIESIKTAVISQLGIAFLPGVTIQRELQAHELRILEMSDLGPEDLQLDYYVIRRTANPVPPSVSRFLELLPLPALGARSARVAD